jgi:2-(1,2-epoxy-1,2-dihydrophenyl)acetyl-CoA isomerase
MTDTVSLSIVGGIATVTLRRPDRLNALDVDTRRALLDRLTEVADDDVARVVVLTGTGRAFCVGQDLAAVEELHRADETVAGTYNPIAQLITDMPQVVIGAVNGLAVGAGMGLALACDLRIAARSASFSCAFGKVALVPDTSVSWHLVREIGHARALELALSGRAVPASEALALGLLNEVVADEDLASRVGELAGTLACGPALSHRLTKRAFRSAPTMTLAESLAMEARHQGQAARHPDHLEGRTAFAEKRPARFA